MFDETPLRRSDECGIADHADGMLLSLLAHGLVKAVKPDTDAPMHKVESTELRVPARPGIAADIPDDRTFILRQV